MTQTRPANACATGGCGNGPCGGKGVKTFKEGVLDGNPVTIQVLGICSALAVTTRVENALVMSCALIFVAAMSNLAVSVLRNAIPSRIRMIAEVTIIATFVILFDQILRAFYWDMSKQLGPYVGLIITNCIVMGRAEAFAMQNPPLVSVVDGISNGIGYALVLLVIAVVREAAGTGAVFGVTFASPSWYVANQFMILAPGAFVVLGIFVWVYNTLTGHTEPEET